jgi:hypothetical protein
VSEDRTGTGIGVDSRGGPVVDPTKNVLDLNDAATKRQDDLRAASDRRQDDLRLAAERLSEATHKHLEQVAELRAAHARELNEAETKRIDAIRAVDVAAVATAADRMATQANVLATPMATQAAATSGQLSERISLLERTSYEGSGKSAVADPQMARMAETLEALNRNMAEGRGKREGNTDNRANVVMIGGLVMVLIAIVSFVIARM